MARQEMSWEDRIVRHRLTITYQVVLGLALIVAIILILKFSFDAREYTDFQVVKSTDTIGASDSVIKPYNNGQILCYSRDGISSYNAKGEQIWNHTYEMQSPIVAFAGEYVVVGDYKGNSIYIMNGMGLCGEIDTNLVILDLNISGKGVVTATLDDKSTTWLNIYSSEGEQIVSVKTSMEQTGFPLTTTMSSDNVKMGVSYLKTGGTSAKTSVAFYNFGDVGQNMTDKIVSGFDHDDCVIPFLRFVTENDAVAVGEHSLTVYSGKQIPDERATVEIPEDIESVYCGDGLVGLVFLNDEGEDKYTIALYNTDAKEVLRRTFNMEYDDILIADDRVLIYNEGEVLLFTKSGVEKYAGTFGEGVRGIVPASGSTKFIVVRDSAMETIKLK
ncbi:MAG: DUF5711 family protein [Lachnospiraceae bacterium]|nr:DUF5711 family protein [Lachnospiraceae bacterium]